MANPSANEVVNKPPSDAERKKMGIGAIPKPKPEPKPKKFAKGGSVRGDGCAQKGKTKGRNC